MRILRLNGGLLKLALAALALAAVAAVACDGDDSSGADRSPAPGSPPADGSPSPAPTVILTPGTGVSPIQAVGTLLNLEGIDGHKIDVTRMADCPLDEVQGTPDLVGRFFVAQFCVTMSDLVPNESIFALVELPETGEAWEMNLEFDPSTSMWEVAEVEKVSD